MNIIDIITRNHFLKRLYPNGLNDISVVSFSTDLTNYTLSIRTNEKPAIKVEKWGEWLKDYDTIEIELRNSFLKKIRCLDWINNKKNICQIDVQQKDNDYKNLRFYDDNAKWSLELEIYGLVFQGCKAYLKEEEDYYPL